MALKLLTKACLMAALTLPLAACESADIDIFSKKEPPLPGVRRDVLPPGAVKIDNSLAMPADVSGTRGAAADPTTPAVRRKKRR